MPRKQEDSVFKGLDLSKLQRKGELTSKLNELHRALRDLSQDPSERFVTLRLSFFLVIFQKNLLIVSNANIFTLFYLSLLISSPNYFISLS